MDLHVRLQGFCLHILHLLEAQMPIPAPGQPLVHRFKMPSLLLRQVAMCFLAQVGDSPHMLNFTDSQQTWPEFEDAGPACRMADAPCRQQL